ncbi:hypothetical protein FNF29_07924 [Cafeteria roenbergensis]|uniref:alpha-galactosidase n=1 Tax=Cafeteria roenbergensis TaxID=33653 RepID=A0A5A8C0V1_CAFRO|nr:hypothetical protein FNF29_07924 [Cafeteria roenbergensis]|eukprot:KAA0146682.1 hypothetical protein FNF29_07924 [Cafeteria roenbergensis]
MSRAELKPGKAVFVEAQRLFLLQGRTTTYAFRIDRNGWLEHLYYGPSVEADDDLSYLRYANVTLPFDPRPTVPPPGEVVQGLASQGDAVLRATWRQWSELNRSTVEAARIENASWRLLNMRASRRNLAALAEAGDSSAAGTVDAPRVEMRSSVAAGEPGAGVGIKAQRGNAASLIAATHAAAGKLKSKGPARAAAKLAGPPRAAGGLKARDSGGAASTAPSPASQEGAGAGAGAAEAAAAVLGSAVRAAAALPHAQGDTAGSGSAQAADDTAAAAMTLQRQLHELASHGGTHVRAAGDIHTMAAPHRSTVASARGMLHGTPGPGAGIPSQEPAPASGAAATSPPARRAGEGRSPGSSASPPHAAAASSAGPPTMRIPDRFSAAGGAAAAPGAGGWSPKPSLSSPLNQGATSSTVMTTHPSLPGMVPGVTSEGAAPGQSAAAANLGAIDVSPRHASPPSGHGTVPVLPAFAMPPPATTSPTATPCEAAVGADLTSCAPSAQAFGLLEDPAEATTSSSSQSRATSVATQSHTPGARPERPAAPASGAGETGAPKSLSRLAPRIGQPEPDDDGQLGLEAFTDEFVRPHDGKTREVDEQAADDDTAAGKNMKLLEWSDAGTGDYRPPSFSVEYPDGSTISPLVYKRHMVHAGKMVMMTPHLPHVREEQPGDADDCTTVAITLEDTFTGLEVELVYTVFRDFDAIARRTIVHNCTADVIRCSRLMSITMDMYAEDHHMVQLSGAWAGERHVVRRKLEQGVSHVESRRGTSSHQHNPFIAITQGPPCEDSGEVVGFALIYSGNFRCEVDVSEAMRARVNVGMNPQLFRWNLNPGESVESPEAIIAYSAAGLGRLSGELHRVVRERIIPQRWRDFVCPVLLNTWEACYFQVTHDAVLSLARAAASVGVQLLMLDDGWFKDRHDDTSSLGDWTPDPVKLPFGLKCLAREVNSLGLAFGLWVEPEMVNVKSELYRRHPDWALQVKGRPRNEGRNQLVLDFANVEVVHYITETLCSLLASAPISAIKWDMNRHLSEVFSPALPARQQGEVAHRYMLGVYQVLATLNERFPQVLIETCSGGGGRFDLGMLFYSPQIWTSDNTDALARVKIQMGSMRPEELAEMRQLVVLRKRLAPIVASGAMYRIWSPFDTNRGAWIPVEGSYWSPAVSKGMDPPMPPVPFVSGSTPPAGEAGSGKGSASSRGSSQAAASSRPSASPPGEDLEAAAAAGAAEAAAAAAEDGAGSAASEEGGEFTMARFGDEALSLMRPGDEAIIMAVCISKDTGHTLPRMRLRGLQGHKRYLVEELVPGTLRRAVGTGQIVHDPAHPVFQFGARRTLNLSGKALMTAGLPARFEFDGDSVCFHLYEPGCPRRESIAGPCAAFGASNFASSHERARVRVREDVDDCVLCRKEVEERAVPANHGSARGDLPLEVVGPDFDIGL